ncbi:hypothetical protein K2173_021069 [Erythroxylum novogranatense]|uniref:COP9 signalosome complex subunit 3 n=1 Tax=Erythroxylum novogranatense TaxID=1862640 RepID=A0AAV8TPQ9_9ROSI|nr:hypothetical protein K2173_021069 [Erythroxylum novogranatense]
MNTVESLVTQIQGLSSSSYDLSVLHNYLKQAEDLLRCESSQLLPFLPFYPFSREACTSSPVSKEQANTPVSIIARFGTCCAVEQIRMAPDFVYTGSGSTASSSAKSSTSSEHLTPLHPDYLQLCLLSKCYKAGLSNLEENIFEVDRPRDFFLYCYYGGMICIGQKLFQKALELLHNGCYYSPISSAVVTSPMSTTINAIAVEAYQKYVLVSLIHHGQYGAGKFSELELYVETNREKFESDKNLGLVKQVVSSMYKRNIQRLTQTYLTLSLQDIANTVQLGSPKEAEMHVLQMIQDGEIYATINQKDGMVRFLEDPEQYKTCEMIERIDSSIQRYKADTMDELISCDPSYIAKAGSERQRLDFDDYDPVPQKFNL